MKNYDAIIIGAGHNGLTNAAFLAKAGLDVVVLEKNDYIGGATAVLSCIRTGNIQTVPTCVACLDLKSTRPLI